MNSQRFQPKEPRVPFKQRSQTEQYIIVIWIAILLLAGISKAIINSEKAETPNVGINITQMDQNNLSTP